MTLTVTFSSCKLLPIKMSKWEMKRKPGQYLSISPPWTQRLTPAQTSEPLSSPAMQTPRFIPSLKWKVLFTTLLDIDMRSCACLISINPSFSYKKVSHQFHQFLYFHLQGRLHLRRQQAGRRCHGSRLRRVQVSFWSGWPRFRIYQDHGEKEIFVL